MVHPGLPDDELKLQDTFIDERRIELDALCSNELFDVLKKTGIILYQNK